MAIDIESLAKSMFQAAWSVLKEKAPEVESYAVGEFKKIAQTVATIELARLKGQVTEEQAKLLFDMQKSASRAVLLTSTGMELLAAEGAINAALAVVRPAVNAALGFALV